MALLHIEKLTLRFGGLTAVKDVDLAIEEGAIFALIGPNGAGKTTVFNAVSGIYDPTAGSIRFQGRPLQLPFTWKVALLAIWVGLITALGTYLLAVNPDLLWRAAIRRPNNEALWLQRPFHFGDAYRQAVRYLQGGLTLEYAPQLVRVPLYEERTGVGDPKLAYNVPGYEIVSADGAYGIRGRISDDLREPQLQSSARAYAILKRLGVGAEAVNEARRQRDQILHEMADDSREIARQALASIEHASLSVTGQGDQWQLFADGQPVAGLSFNTELAAQEAVKSVEALRTSLPRKLLFRLAMPLLGFILGAAGYLTVWNRARRTPDVIARGGVARTFQNIRLFPNMTVVENVLVGMDRHYSSNILAMIFRTPAVRGEEQRRYREALELLKFAGLERSADTLAKNLSYGNQRRLEIARALASQPKLLMLDEPAAGMNPAESAELMKLIRAIRDRGITVLLIEHHMKLVMGISDRIAVLEYGLKIAEGTPEEVRQNPRVIEAYLGKDEHP